MANSALTLLADVLSARRDLPEVSTRMGQVASVARVGTVWYAEVKVGGSDVTRRMRWLGNGGQPNAGDIVAYIDQSPYPLMLGRVSSDSENQNFGNGQITAGTIVDGQGNLRTGITGAVTTATAAGTQASAATAAATAAQNTASTALSQASAAQNTASAALSAANAATNTANVAAAAANQASNGAASAQQAVSNLSAQVNTLTAALQNETTTRNQLSAQVQSIGQALTALDNYVTILTANVNWLWQRIDALEATVYGP